MRASAAGVQLIMLAVCALTAPADDIVAPRVRVETFEQVGPGNVLLVANGAYEGSRELAKYYAEKRSIAPENLVILDAPPGEDIDRESFNLKIRDPLREKAAELGPGIRCFIVFRGVPLNIWDPQPTDKEISNLKQQLAGINERPSGGDIKAIQNEIAELEQEVRRVSVRAASVDSELALLGREHPLEGRVASPFLAEKGWPEGCYWVSRLDATTSEAVRGMIDGAIEAEREGLSGICYFDARGLVADDAYSRADEAIRRAARLAGAHGYAAVVDNKEELFGEGACPDAAIYWGWYSLTKYVDSFTFRPGAVAVHIASGECNSLRTGAYWCRNLIANGAAVTMGPTNEPYLDAFVEPDEFLGRLFAGASVGEAYYATERWLSWRMVLLGDPLYRPFQPTAKSAGTQPEKPE